MQAALVRSLEGRITMVQGAPGISGNLAETNSNFDPTQTNWSPHHHVEAAVDWFSPGYIVNLLTT